MNLDIQKMRRLSLSGIDINKLAPSLFDNDHGDQNFTQKAGANLEWYLTDFEKVKKLGNPSSNNKWSDNSATTRTGREPEQKKIIVSDQKIILSCHQNVITMGDLGEIGWYLKLENNVQNKVNSNQRKDKEKERIR